MLTRPSPLEVVVWGAWVVWEVVAVPVVPEVAQLLAVAQPQEAVRQPEVAQLLLHCN